MHHSRTSLSFFFQYRITFNTTPLHVSASYSAKVSLLTRTQFQVLSRKLPLRIVLKIFEVDVNVIIVTWSHHLDHLKLWFIHGCLFANTKRGFTRAVCFLTVVRGGTYLLSHKVHKQNDNDGESQEQKRTANFQNFKVVVIVGRAWVEKIRKLLVKTLKNNFIWQFRINNLNSLLPLEAWGEITGDIENLVLHVVPNEFVTQNFK